MSKREGKRVLFIVPDDHLAKLAAIAEERGTSRTALVREVIAEYIERHAKSTNKSSTKGASPCQ
jgi:predicted transcriptional regulator